MTSSSDHQWSELSDSIIQIIETTIHQANDQLRSVSLEIHAHPELGWEEHYAHDALTTFMESKGFEVEQHAYGMETAWRATYEVGQGGRTIGFNSESEYAFWRVSKARGKLTLVCLQWMLLLVSDMRVVTT